METRADYNAEAEQIEVRDARTEDRFFVDNIILRGYGPTLGVYGISVYTALCMHANLKTQSGFPSHSKIAELLGCSTAKVKEAIRLLHSLKLIHIEPRYDAETGRQTSNLYTLLTPPPVTPPGTTDTPPQYNQGATNNPNADQSSLNHVGASAQEGEPEREDDSEWPTNPAQERLDRMRQKFGPDLGTMILTCNEAQKQEGTWTVPSHHGLSPQCSVFKEATGYAPAPAVREDIDNAVPADDLERLEFWYNVCHDWVLCGFSPKNVGRMLYYYNLGVLVSDTMGQHKGKRNGGPSTPHTEDEKAEDDDIMSRLFDENGRRRQSEHVEYEEPAWLGRGAAGG